jgi:hypothetical protein
VEGSRSSGKSALPANHFPDRFALDPSWLGSESARFAFVMRFEPHDPSTRFEGARACTVGAFHERMPMDRRHRQACGEQVQPTDALLEVRVHGRLSDVTPMRYTGNLTSFAGPLDQARER